MTLSERYRRILDRIGEAAVRSGRDPSAVRLIGVTKKIDAATIREALECGLAEIGENRVQEAEEKLPLLGTGPVACHLIGHLQSNKARKAASLFSSIQSVDSVALARRLDRAATGTLPVFIQLNLGGEETKAGVEESGLVELVEAVREFERLDLQGLMAIPPFFEDRERVRPFFRRLREAAAALGLREVSMGMSHDFEIAIEEGATMVRIGTALFGGRG